MQQRQVAQRCPAPDRPAPDRPVMRQELGAANRDQPVFEQAVRFRARMRVAAEHDRGVAAVQLEGRRLARRIDQHVHRRVATPELGQARQQPSRGKGRRRGDAELRARSPAQLGHGHLQAVKAFGKVLGDPLAVLGQRNRPVSTAEQRQPELGLQVADAVADGGGCQAQLLRRAREAQAPGRRLEGLQSGQRRQAVGSGLHEQTSSERRRFQRSLPFA